MISASTIPIQQTTTYKVVIPFYLYAALAFLLACGLLFAASEVFYLHYFNPEALAITHLMVLGWGTMIILGTSHQLIPVLIEGKLYSEKLAFFSFVFAAVGIPLLVYGFYRFHMGWPAILGGGLLNMALLAYLINVVGSIIMKKSGNIYAVFMLTATFWLLLTTGSGWLLVLNFSYEVFSKNSLAYLPLHAHLGLVGWFLVMIVGVGARLIPMFLISKFTNDQLLWGIYALLNLALVVFVASQVCPHHSIPLYMPVLLGTFGIILFCHYCRQAFMRRVKKKVDRPMKVSLLSVGMSALLPILLILVVAYIYFNEEKIQLVLLYGFLALFGWLTAIILGMTFKTLPFIVWNRIYQVQSGIGKTPCPKDLYSERLFLWMTILYIDGILSFGLGLLMEMSLLLKAGAGFLLFAALLYNINVFKIIYHKPFKI
jgi:hypothetical protein